MGLSSGRPDMATMVLNSGRSGMAALVSDRAESGSEYRYNTGILGGLAGESSGLKMRQRGRLLPPRSKSKMAWMAVQTLSQKTNQWL